MTSLRRTVEGWMGDDLYGKLGDEPNIELTWKLLRDLIGQQLFGTEYVAVPYIQSAAYYNQLFVFIKKRKLLSTLCIKPPTYKVVGNLDYLINRNFSTWVPQFDYSPWDVADGLTMYKEYKLRVSSNQAGLRKVINLSIVDAHARSAQLPVPGSLNIYRDMVEDISKTNTLYVITDVVYASYLRLSIEIGEQRQSMMCDRSIPIGFKYRKYKINNYGTFNAELPTSLQFTDREANWLVPIQQPIPTVPRWDPMRRRYTGLAERRKTRNNLTIPTPEQPRRSTWLQEGGLVQVERPIMNDDPVQEGDDNRQYEENDWRYAMHQRRVRHPEILNHRRALSLENIPINE